MRKRKKKSAGLFLLLAMVLLSLAAGYFLMEREDPPGRAQPGEGSSFQVHFIDVGQADSALVICDGHYMLIDGGNAGDSDLVFAYL